MSDIRPLPSPTAMLIATAVLAGISGYMIGIASTLGFLPIPFQTKVAPVGKARRKTDNYDNEEESSEEDIDDESILDHAPNWSNGLEADKRDGLRASPALKKQAEAKKEVEVKSDPSVPAAWENASGEHKLVLVVRTDLGMTKGKIAAQCGHATLACYKHFLRNDPKSQTLRKWERSGQAKIAVQIKGEDEMHLLQAKAISLGLVAEVIADAGRTQIEAGSYTVLGIGPAPASVINQVTGHLKLL